MTTFAYLRVSTDNKGQTTDNQRMQLAGVGFAIDKFISEDGVSGSVPAFDRPAFSAMLSEMKPSDTCIVVAVDRIGRNAIDVLTVIEDFKKRGIKLRVAQFDGIDLTSSTGKLLVTVMAAIAEMEKASLVERTLAGLARTKAQGTKLGPPLTIEPEMMCKMIADRNDGMTLDKLVEVYGVPRNTIYRNVNQWTGKEEEYAAEWAARKHQYALKVA